MTWSVHYNPDAKIVEVIYSGSVNGTDLQQAVAERVRLQQDHASRGVLLDCSLVEHMAGGSLEVHNLPAELYEYLRADRRTSHALILSQFPKAREASWHYETACINRGWRVKTFENRQAAIDWLQREMAADMATENDLPI